MMTTAAAAATAFYLVLSGSYNAVIIPVPYPTKTECVAAGKAQVSDYSTSLREDGLDSFRFACVPAPRS